MSFESDLAVEKKLVKKTSEAMNNLFKMVLFAEPYTDIVEMGLEIPDDVIIMHKGKVDFLLQWQVHGILEQYKVRH